MEEQASNISCMENFYFISFLHPKAHFFLHRFCKISAIVTNVPQMPTVKTTELCINVTTVLHRIFQSCLK
uniref:Uncharacterized protein n=1 Tax=Coptotermes formosanus TaxID=36987 RepID=R4UVB8_COPFO|nr:hypothetical protein [Coptotermes formosanus]